MSTDSMKGKALKPDELQTLLKAYDKDGSHSLSEEEIQAMVADYKENKVSDPSVRRILSQYDDNQDGYSQ